MESSGKEKLGLRLVIGSLLISCAILAYLTFKHFDLYTSQSPESSICNVSAVFDCDSVNVSPYAKFLGIPMALWGFFTNLVTLAFFLIYWLGGKSDRLLGQLTFGLSLFMVLMSVVMAALSAKMEVYCLFCIALYFLSLLTFGGMTLALPRPWLGSIGETFKGLFATHSTYVATVVMVIPFLSWLSNVILWDVTGSQVKESVEESVRLWETENPVTIEPTFFIHKGSKNAKMAVIEFGDFTCPHCKIASESLNLFGKSHPDVSISFLPFPRDGACNQNVPDKVEFPCLMAKAAYCAQFQQKEWALHDYFFSHQTELHSPEAVLESLSRLEKTISLDRKALDQCMQDEKTQQLLAQQNDLAKSLKFRGVPTFYINQRFVSAPNLLTLLNTIYEKIQNP